MVIEGCDVMFYTCASIQVETHGCLPVDFLSVLRAASSRCAAVTDTETSTLAAAMPRRQRDEQNRGEQVLSANLTAQLHTATQHWSGSLSTNVGSRRVM